MSGEGGDVYGAEGFDAEVEGVEESGGGIHIVKEHTVSTFAFQYQPTSSFDIFVFIGVSSFLMSAVLLD